MPEPAHVPSTKPRYVITLVHGTHARGAAWTRQDSPIRKELTNKLKGPVHFGDPFEWSGRNRNKDRIEASVKLAQHLKDGKDAFPHAQHFVIATATGETSRSMPSTNQGWITWSMG